MCNEVCFDVSQQATTVAAWAFANARKCNLKAVIERDWKHKNRLICDEDQQHNGNRDQRKPCLRWGYCICSPSGREVHRLRNALVKVLKLRCPPRVAFARTFAGCFSCRQACMALRGCRIALVGVRCCHSVAQCASGTGDPPGRYLGAHRLSQLLAIPPVFPNLGTRGAAIGRVHMVARDSAVQVRL